jgi:hypothetical protein
MKPEIERLRGFRNEAAHLQYVCSVSEGGERSDEELADCAVVCTNGAHDTDHDLCVWVLKRGN